MKTLLWRSKAQLSSTFSGGGVSLKSHFALAFAVRLLFTAYGLYLDARVQQVADEAGHTDGASVMPKYTDIDYQVFTDAASYVYQNESPYMRDTYRYTPLLAIVLQPNVFWLESFGKFVFIVFDLLCGYLILKINESVAASDGGARADNRNKAAICFWFYNPITIAIASRGNAESIMSFLVLAFVYQLMQQHYVLAGAFYALAVHFKIYPITYGLAILLHLMLVQLNACAKTQRHYGDVVRAMFLNARIYKFGLTALVCFCSITYAFYSRYGYEFLHETYLYHLSRQDIRHNFSPYFYMLYLTDLTWASSLALKCFGFLPQAFLVLVFSYYLHEHLELCLFSITFAFVAFNKVCTSQYFVWYLSLLPLLVPKLRLSANKAGSCFLLWLGGQGLWLYFAYELEFNGQNTFVQLWLASLLFLGINCFLLKYAILDNYDINDNDNSEATSKRKVD